MHFRNTESDARLALAIAYADRARGVNWSKPKSVKGCRPMPRLRALAAGAVIAFTSLMSGTAAAGGLADAVAAAYGKSAAHISAHSKSAPKAKRPAPKAPTCGAWVELWQGSGKGRTCEAGAL